MRGARLLPRAGLEPRVLRPRRRRLLPGFNDLVTRGKARLRRHIRRAKGLHSAEAEAIEERPMITRHGLMLSLQVRHRLLLMLKVRVWHLVVLPDCVGRMRVLLRYLRAAGFTIGAQLCHGSCGGHLELLLWLVVLRLVVLRSRLLLRCSFAPAIQCG